MKTIEVLQAGFYLFSLVGIVLAYVQYRRNGLVEKQKVTNALLDKLFDPRSLQDIRTLLDYNKEGTKRLKSLILSDSDEDADLQEKFINYLNFFEYRGYLLLHAKQLDIEDANTLFGYYVNLIDKLEIDDWLYKNGFTFTKRIIPELKFSVRKQWRS